MKRYRVFLTWEILAESEKNAVVTSHQLLLALKHQGQIEYALLDDALEVYNESDTALV